MACRPASGAIYKRLIRQLAQPRRSFTASSRSRSSLYNLNARALSQENQWFSKRTGISHVEHSPIAQLLRAEGKLALQQSKADEGQFSISPAGYKSQSSDGQLEASKYEDLQFQGQYPEPFKRSEEAIKDSGRKAEVQGSPSSQVAYDPEIIGRAYMKRTRIQACENLIHHLRNENLHKERLIARYKEQVALHDAEKAHGQQKQETREEGEKQKHKPSTMVNVANFTLRVGLFVATAALGAAIALQITKRIEPSPKESAAKRKESKQEWGTLHDVASKICALKPW